MGCCTNHSGAPSVRLQLRKYDIFLIFMTFTAIYPLIISNFYFPAFASVLPTWKCGSATTFSSNCSELQRCKKEGRDVEIESPFLTVAQDLNLYCDGSKGSRLALMGSLQMAGMIFGSLIFGQLSDSYGRKTITLVTGIGTVVFSTCSTFLSQWVAIGVLRFVSLFFDSGLMLASQTLMIEGIAPQQRMFACAFFWAAGYSRVIYALSTYATGDWRNGLRVPNLTAVPVLIIIAAWIHESPQWLRQKRRQEKVLRVLHKIDKFNGNMDVSEHACTMRKPLPPLIDTPNELLMEREEAPNGCEKAGLKPVSKNSNSISKPSPNARRPDGYRKLLCTTAFLRRRCAMAALFYFTASLVTFGLDMASGQLAGNFFVNQCAIGLLSQAIKPAIFWFDRFCPNFNRRTLHQGSLGIVLVIISVVAVLSGLQQTTSIGYAITAFSIGGRCLIEYHWDAAMLYGLELFPTSCRNSGISFAATLGRLGDVLAPQLILLGRLWRPAPFLVLLVVGAVDLAVAWFFAPNTKDVELDDDFDENQQETTA